ncbi:MAG: ATP-binding protein [Polyangiaceae bacterium]|nr:ATP-binding protein [Polyangiaceae bacterium]
MTLLRELPNPFSTTVVQDAWQAPPDVAQIHDSVFQACLAGLANAGRGQSDSLLVYGPAGSGKTHLLSRVQRHLRATGPAAPDRVQHCVFVFVRLQTSSQLLWQHLRRRLGADLMRREQGLTQLQRLIAHQVALGRGETPGQAVLALRVLSSEDQEAVSSYVAEVVQRLELGRDLGVVLEHLVSNRFVLDSSAWLRGDSLPEAALERLGLGPIEQEDADDAARQVVTALCRMAGPTLPIVFCFDQVEALQQTSTDREAFFRFGRMAADVFDSNPNLLLITCVQSAMLDSFEASVRDADRDRIFRHRALLAPLTREQIEQLVLVRLGFVPALGELRATRPSARYYPLDERLVAELTELFPCTPRRVLARCSARFEQLQLGRVPPKQSLPEFLGQQLAKRRQAASSASRSEDSARVLIHGLNAHCELRGIRLERTDNAPAGVDAVLPLATPIALSVRDETNMSKLAAKLRRLLDAQRSMPERVVIVRDASLAISRSAHKTNEYLAELLGRGAKLVRPEPSALAALEALSSLVSDAKAGELAQDGEAVGVSAVLEWLRSLKDEPTLEEIDGLISELVAEPSPSSGALAEALTELLAREHVVRLDSAAAELSTVPEAVREAVVANPARFGILEGPPALVLDLSDVLEEAQAQ